MRSPGVIYRRYRQIRKKILYDCVLEARKKCFENCYYGKEITLIDQTNSEHTVKSCSFTSLPEGRIELCYKPHSCNAFVNNKKKEEIINEVEKKLSDYQIKKKNYPELILLEWVLDKDLNEATKKPSFFGRLIIFCIDVLEKILKRTKKRDLLMDSEA